MHHVTSHGATKITMDSKERDYQERLRQAKAQGDGNPQVMGVQAPESQISTANNTPIEDTRNQEAGFPRRTVTWKDSSKIQTSFKLKHWTSVLLCTPRLLATLVTA